MLHIYRKTSSYELHKSKPFTLIYERSLITNNTMKITENQSRNLKAMSNCIESRKYALRKEQEDFLKECLSISTEWSVPHCFWGIIDASADAAAPAICLWYRHDCAWVVPFGVKLEEKLQSADVSGIECMEYSQDEVSGVTTYDIEDVCGFLSWYIEVFHPYLEDLKSRLLNTHRVGDIGIVLDEWCEEYCYEREFLNDQEVMDWFNDELNKK